MSLGILKLGALLYRCNGQIPAELTPHLPQLTSTLSYQKKLSQQLSSSDPKKVLDGLNAIKQDLKKPSLASKLMGSFSLEENLFNSEAFKIVQKVMCAPEVDDASNSWVQGMINNLQAAYESGFLRAVTQVYVDAEKLEESELLYNWLIAMHERNDVDPYLQMDDYVALTAIMRRTDADIPESYIQIEWSAFHQQASSLWKAYDEGQIPVFHFTKEMGVLFEKFEVLKKNLSQHPTMKVFSDSGARQKLTYKTALVDTEDPIRTFADAFNTFYQFIDDLKKKKQLLMESYENWNKRGVTLQTIQKWIETDASEHVTQFIEKCQPYLKTSKIVSNSLIQEARNVRENLSGLQLKLGVIAYEDIERKRTSEKRLRGPKKKDKSQTELACDVTELLHMFMQTYLPLAKKYLDALANPQKKPDLLTTPPTPTKQETLPHSIAIPLMIDGLFKSKKYKEVSAVIHHAVEKGYGTPKTWFDFFLRLQNEAPNEIDLITHSFVMAMNLSHSILQNALEKRESKKNHAEVKSVFSQILTWVNKVTRRLKELERWDLQEKTLSAILDKTTHSKAAVLLDLAFTQRKQSLFRKAYETYIEAFSLLFSEIEGIAQLLIKPQGASSEDDLVKAVQKNNYLTEAFEYLFSLRNTLDQINPPEGSDEMAVLESFDEKWMKLREKWEESQPSAGAWLVLAEAMEAATTPVMLSETVSAYARALQLSIAQKESLPPQSDELFKSAFDKLVDYENKLRGKGFAPEFAIIQQALYDAAERASDPTLRKAQSQYNLAAYDFRKATLLPVSQKEERENLYQQAFSKIVEAITLLDTDHEGDATVEYLLTEKNLTPRQRFQALNDFLEGLVDIQRPIFSNP